MTTSTADMGVTAPPSRGQAPTATDEGSCRPVAPTLQATYQAVGGHGPQIAVFDLGVAPYLPVQELQCHLREQVAEGIIPGILLLLEHEPIITLGGRAGLEDLRFLPGDARAPLEVVASERGGLATLHAPGQLVSYPVVPIPNRDLSMYVHGLEEVLITVLARIGIEASRRNGYPGLYVAGNKIASVGLRCQRWISSHGTSLNVTVDLSLFDLIVSCGEPGLRQTSVRALTGRSPSMAHIKSLYVEAACQVFGWDLSPVQAARYDQVGRMAGIEIPIAGVGEPTE